MMNLSVVMASLHDDIYASLIQVELTQPPVYASMICDSYLFGNWDTLELFQGRFEQFVV